MSRPRALVLSVVATLVATAGALGLTSSPAHAALCSGTSGVSVVVDYRSLGGGTVQACDSSGGGQIAHGIFARAGVDQREAAREPGFVCRVNNQPSNDPCVNASPANASWAMYWSDGDGRWNYSSLGARSLRVPEGGFVAWSFQNGDGNVAPGVSPRRMESTPAPPPSKPKPRTQPSAEPTRAPTAPQTTRPTTPPRAVPATPPSSPPSSPDPVVTTSGAGTSPGREVTTRGRDGAAPSPTVRSRAGTGERQRARQGRATASASASPSGEAGGASSPGTTPSAEEQVEAGALAPAAVLDDQPEGLPWWVPAGVLAGLVAAGASAAWWRRRTA